MSKKTFQDNLVECQSTTVYLLVEDKSITNQLFTGTHNHILIVYQSLYRLKATYGT